MSDAQSMTPFDWALRPLRKYATFTGRAPRAEYWWYYLGTIIVSIPFRLFDRFLDTQQALMTILDLALLLPWIAVSVRRLHDTNRSGWWLLLIVAVLGAMALMLAVMATVSDKSPLGFTSIIFAVLLVLAVAVTLLVFMVLPGTEGPNDYGDDPYGRSNLEEVFA